jgi:hypothetical protein
MRDPAALLGDLDHALDGGVGKIEQRAVRGLHDSGLALDFLLVFLSHMFYSVGSTPKREFDQCQSRRVRFQRIVGLMVHRAKSAAGSSFCLISEEKWTHVFQK